MPLTTRLFSSSYYHPNENKVGNNNISLTFIFLLSIFFFLKLILDDIDGRLNDLEKSLDSTIKNQTTLEQNVKLASNNASTSINQSEQN